MKYQVRCLYTCQKTMEKHISEGGEIRHGEEEVDILMQVGPLCSSGREDGDAEACG